MPLRFFSHTPFVIGWASSTDIMNINIYVYGFKFKGALASLYAFRPVHYHLLL